MGSLTNDEAERELHKQEEFQEEEEEEPILMEQPQKYCMFPIMYPQLWEMYKKAVASFWTGNAYNAHLITHTHTHTYTIV